MGVFLQSLRDGGPSHAVEKSDEGFVVKPRGRADRDAFNRLAREVMEHSGDDYVALPRYDGPANYDRIFIIPIDG
ncbi:hypothetical protein N0B44_06990 [Roseibacterium beibuensis]|uniref:hypothetical protein n=1 Tax=[Roseibacterium] beibuensis TaxID=1193142 RepID=UPI00217E0A5B|nr:hypothetical protein [Roseibacterium beibuensis]MCS6622649.1 hypothetical protein [Roseibacterium beibuensis]